MNTGRTSTAEDISFELRGPSEEVAPLSVRRVLNKHLGSVILYLRHSEGPLRDLEASEWLLFVSIVAHLSEYEVSPTHARLMELSGFSKRAVTRHVKTLAARGVLRRSQSVGGSPVYRLGECVEGELGALARELDAQLWPFAQGAVSRREAVATLTGGTADPGDRIYGVTSDTVANSGRRDADPGDRIDRVASDTVANSGRRDADPGDRLDTPVASVAPPSLTHVGTGIPRISAAIHETRPSDTLTTTAHSLPSARSEGFPLKTKELNSFLKKGDSHVAREELAREDEEVAHRAIACNALTAFFRRLHPDRPVPRRFSASDVALVVECGGGAPGDREALEGLHADAIEGAIINSRSRPPTLRFIWGKQEHFLAHADVGRAKRLAASKPATVVRPRPPQQGEVMPLESVAATLGMFLQSFDSAVPSLSRTTRRFDSSNVETHTESTTHLHSERLQ